MSEKQHKPKNQNTVFIAIKVPRAMAAEIDRIVTQNDTDKSKFMRAAVREKIARIKAS